MDDLTRRALADYYLKGGDKFASRSSGVFEYKGARYVVIRGSGRSILAVYNVEGARQQIRRANWVKPWPAEFRGSHGSGA